MHADLPLIPPLLASFLLVLARLGGILVFVPIPGTRMVVEPARVLLVLSLCLALYPMWPALEPAALTPGQFLLWMAGESLLGVGVGVMVGFLSESLVFGVQSLVVQAGFSYASAVDPASQADSTVLQLTAQLMANFLFFTSGVDRMIIKAFARSLESCPPGTALWGWAEAERIVSLGGDMLELGLRLALPISGLLLLTDLALALVGRMQAELQLLSLAFPVKLLGSLAALAALTPLIAWIYRSGLSKLAVALSQMVH